MKNITLSVSEETLREVRRIAAQRETTVNALVREYLDRLAANQARRARLRRNLARFAARSRAEVGPIRWSRDDTHER
jgi:Asp-tRNA(Asn)/Glu-tRNA(Gln) amidotransferase A subunit family amidase